MPQPADLVLSRAPDCAKPPDGTLCPSTNPHPPVHVLFWAPWRSPSSRAVPQHLQENSCNVAASVVVAAAAFAAATIAQQFPPPLPTLPASAAIAAAAPAALTTADAAAAATTASSNRTTCHTHVVGCWGERLTNFNPWVQMQTK